MKKLKKGDIKVVSKDVNRWTRTVDSARVAIEQAEHEVEINQIILKGAKVRLERAKLEDR